MIVIGLGNPGLKYHGTRHNVGRMFVDRLAKKYGGRFHNKRGYRIADLKKLNPDLWLAKLNCYMNVSGPAVAALLNQEKHDDLLIVLDDLNLPLGRIRLRVRGSDGGHLGLRSIITCLNTDEVLRLRIGVGRPVTDAVEYVLSPFSRSEKKILQEVIEAGIKGVEMLLNLGLVPAQNYINSVDLSPSQRI